MAEKWNGYRLDDDVVFPEPMSAALWNALKWLGLLVLIIYELKGLYQPQSSVLNIQEHRGISRGVLYATSPSLRLFALDAGTGIRSLGQKMVSEQDYGAVNVDVLLSHTHWDHIQGFPFFTPAYDLSAQINILMDWQHHASV